MFKNETKLVIENIFFQIYNWNLYSKCEFDGIKTLLSIHKTEILFVNKTEICKQNKNIFKKRRSMKNLIDFHGILKMGKPRTKAT